MGETPIHRATRPQCRWRDCPASKKPLKKGLLYNWLRGLDLNQRPSGYEPDELPDCSTPRQSWAKSIRTLPLRVNRTPGNDKARSSAGPTEIWYRGGDSNPYSLWPLPPQGSVSTNSTTSAKRVLLLLRNLRHVSLFDCRLLLFEHRNIFNCWLFLLHFQHRRIGQTSLRQIISFLFSKEG